MDFQLDRIGISFFWSAEGALYKIAQRFYNLTKGFYQYINRLAHLYLLRVLNKIPAYLVFVYFVNDHTHIPTSRQDQPSPPATAWQGGDVPFN